MTFKEWIKQDWIYFNRKKFEDGKVELTFTMHPLFVLTIIIVAIILVIT